MSKDPIRLKFPDDKDIARPDLVQRSVQFKERTRMGLQAARERGRVGGRTPKIKPNQRTEILRMVNSGKTSAAEAARLFGRHRSSVSRLISQARAENPAAVG